MDSILTGVLHVAIFGSALALLLWTATNVELRNPDGSIGASFCALLSGALALLIMSLGKLWGVQRCAFWLTLALLGEAAALQLIEAGPWVRYQHYRSLQLTISETNPLVLLVLAGQMVAVCIGVAAHRRELRVWLARAKSWQLVAVSLVFCLSSATISERVPTYLAELVFASFLQTVNLANIALAVCAIPRETLLRINQRLSTLFKKDHETPTAVGRFDRVALLAFLWTIAATSFLSWTVYERHPHIPDEGQYLFQARYFAEGRLMVPAPPVPEGFAYYLVPYQEAQWYSIFPPGWPAMLAIGVLAGIPWLVNPLMAGLNTLLAYSFLRNVYDLSTARKCMLLMSASPWFLFMGMNFMAHTATLTFALTAGFAMISFRKTGKAKWAFLAGCAVGVVLLIRPLDGLIVGAIAGLWILIYNKGGSRAVGVTALALGATAIGSLMLPYNFLITGDPMLMPLTAYYDKYLGPGKNDLGFGPERGLGWPIDPFPGHSPLDAVVNANLNLFSVNTELLGWSTGSLLLAAIALFSMSHRRGDYLMIVVIAVTAAMYSLYWFSGGPDFGARYWYLMLVPLLALTVRGSQIIGRGFASTASDPLANDRVLAGTLLLILLALVNYVPWRAIDKYRNYRGMRPDVRYLAEKHNFGKSLVLIRTDSEEEYASAWVYNPLNPFADAPVYAWDRNRRVRARLLEAYRDRPIWIINGPSVTHGRFSVVAGPVWAPDLRGDHALSHLF